MYFCNVMTYVVILRNFLLSVNSGKIHEIFLFYRQQKRNAGKWFPSLQNDKATNEYNPLLYSVESLSGPVMYPDENTKWTIKPNYNGK